MGGGVCQKWSSNYRYDCLLCPTVGKTASYHGETSRGVYNRQLEHDADMRRGNLKSPLVKHGDIQHGGIIPDYKLTVVSHHKKAMERQNAEGVFIVLGKEKITLNSKAEFNQAPLVRVVAIRGLQTDQELQL